MVRLVSPQEHRRIVADVQRWVQECAANATRKTGISMEDFAKSWRSDERANPVQQPKSTS